MSFLHEMESEVKNAQVLGKEFAISSKRRKIRNQTTKKSTKQIHAFGCKLKHVNEQVAFK